MKIFLDIGANEGQTLNEVIKKEYAFDKIICFEPSKIFLIKLNKFALSDKRIQICNFGLSNKNEEVKLFEAGTLSGSIFKREDIDKSNSEIIKLVDTQEWFNKNIKSDDLVFVKINCEGSEVDILDSLIEGGGINNIYSVLITFDIREFEKLQHKEIEIRRRLKDKKLTNYCFSDHMMIGNTHEKRIKNWLKTFGANHLEESKENLKRIYQKEFLKFSSKSGFFTRYEIRLKRIIKYKNFPSPAKSFLKNLKKILGFSRENNFKY